LPPLDANTESDVRIDGLRAEQHVDRGGRWNRTLVAVETDAGVTGYGEAGANGPTVRGQLQQMEGLLVGEDPLEVEKLYDRMMAQQHSHRPHVPTVSGVDIALWDLAGKLLDRPVSKLLTGRFRESVPLYVNTGPEDLLDPAACEAWADALREDPDGPSAVKLTFDSVIEAQSSERGEPSGTRRDRPTLTQTELDAVRRAAGNVREALGRDIDFIAHCHNEWDLPSAKGLAEAVAPANPLWLEDPLPVDYVDNWTTLSRDAPCRVLTGEKLEGVREFEPFVVDDAVDVVQPDLVFAGGLTGGRRIAHLADRHYLPVTAHNTGGLVQNAATVHFAASVRNFWMTETKITQADYVRGMGDAPGLDVENGRLGVPGGPGLGVTLDEDALADMVAASDDTR
jgi:L-alanine-DL-glutamate epimerase-like enolase superfamily enzyme